MGKEKGIGEFKSRRIWRVEKSRTAEQLVRGEGIVSRLVVL